MTFSLSGIFKRFRHIDPTVKILIKECPVRTGHEREKNSAALPGQMHPGMVTVYKK